MPSETGQISGSLAIKAASNFWNSLTDLEQSISCADCAEIERLTWGSLHGPAGVTAGNRLVDAAWRFDNLGLANLGKATILRNFLCMTHHACQRPVRLVTQRVVHRRRRAVSSEIAGQIC